jgi:hypothetical protein
VFEVALNLERSHFVPELLNRLPWWGWLILFILFLFYVGMPLMVLVRFRFDKQLAAIPVGGGLTPEMVRYFRKLSENLRDERFVASAPFVTPGAVGPTLGVSILLVERSSGTVAIGAIAVTRVAKGQEVKTTEWIEFMTRFEDGTAVLTGNSATLTAFAKVPHRDSIQLPQIASPSRLYRIHRKRVELSPSKHLKRTCPPPGGELAFATQAIIEEVASQVETGYVRDAGGSYRATIVGAFAMVYKQLPPFKQIRDAMNRSRGNALIAKLDPDPR